MVHEDRDDLRNDLAENVGAVAHLLAVHAAVPGGTAVDELISQDIHAGKYGD